MKGMVLANITGWERADAAQQAQLQKGVQVSALC